MRFEKRWRCTECGAIHASWLKAAKCHHTTLQRVRVALNDDGTLAVRGSANDPDEDDTFGLMNDLMGYGP